MDTKDKVLKEIFDKWQEIDEKRRPEIVSNVFRMQMVLKKIGVLNSDKFIPNHALNTMDIDDLRYVEIRACDALFDNAGERGADIWSFESIDKLMEFFNESRI